LHAQLLQRDGGAVLGRGRSVRRRGWSTDLIDRAASEIEGESNDSYIRYRGHAINSWIMSQQIPRGRLIVYPDAGHAAHYQYPELFLKHSKLFLDL
jgi:hypothetical protein